MTDRLPEDVSINEKLLLALYRIDEAMQILDTAKAQGWASAHMALCKAKAALGIDLIEKYDHWKPQVKEIEARLYAERGIK